MAAEFFQDKSLDPAVSGFDIGKQDLMVPRARAMRSVIVLG